MDEMIGGRGEIGWGVYEGEENLKEDDLYRSAKRAR